MTTITIDVPEHVANLIHDVGEQLPLVIEMGVSRLAPVSTQAYMEALALFAQNPSQELLATFQFSSTVEERINDLVERNEDGLLSQAERVELDRLSYLEGQLQLVKARALAALKTRS
ncbi:MAG: hypothetical protein R2911_46435 [Caldilineaceae bacterium]